MSINDPVVVVCQPDHPKPYYLKQGRETFYDEERLHIRFKTIEECILYARDELGVDPLDHLPEGAQERGEIMLTKWQEETRQLSLDLE